MKEVMERGAGAYSLLFLPQDGVVLITRMKILPRAPSSGIFETGCAAHSSLSDIKTGQSTQELRAHPTWQPGTSAGAQHARQSIRYEKGQGGDTSPGAQ